MPSESTHKNRDIKEFSEKEKENLKKLNDSFEKLSKAVQDSKELKKLKNEKMLEWLSSILNSEKSLVKLYAEHLEVIKKLLKIYSELTIQRENKLKVLAKLEDISSKRKILQKFNEFFEGWNDSFEAVINAIGSNPNKLSNSGSTSSEKVGGGGNNQKIQLESRHKKH